MYKRMTIDQLKQTNTGFFKNLHAVYSKKGHQHFQAFMHKLLENTNSHYFFTSWNPLLRIQKHEEEYRLVDEVDKIEILCDQEGINEIHNILKNMRLVNKAATENKTIIEGLFQKCMNGDLQYIMEKPFVTYDIETTYTDEGWLASQYFEMAYSVSTQDVTKGLQYNYIDRVSMHRYLDYLLEYPGWIIGYNHIWFDNPVLINNVPWYGQAELEILNKKSIDPFLLLHKLLRRRLKLTKVAESLVSMGKTLDSWAEGAKLLQDWKNTGDEKTLRIVKKYCKNDVRITLGVFLYLLEHKKIHIEGESKEFTLEEMIQRWWAKNLVQENSDESNSQSWLFI